MYIDGRTNYQVRMHCLSSYISDGHYGLTLLTLGFAGGDEEEWDEKIDFADDGVDKKQQHSSQQSPSCTLILSASNYMRLP